MEFDDISVFLKIRNLSKEYLHNNSEFSIEQAQNWFIQTSPKFFLIEMDSNVIGYFRTSNWKNDTLYIGCDLHPDYRGMGIGYESYLKFIKKLKYEFGIKTIQLEVLSTNYRAIHLYKKLGFKEIGIADEKIIRNNQTIDSIIMESKIDFEIEKLKIIIPTCDKYIHILEALMYTTRKYWKLNNEFIILGYDEPKFELDENWKFVSLGKDSGPSNWSNDLLNFFSSFKDEYFINMIDDTLMTRESDIVKIEKVFNYMQKNKSIKKCFLQGSLSVGGKGLLGDIEYTAMDELNGDFYEINQLADYRSSIQSAIWSTEYFLEVLKPNLSPWDFELQHVKNDGARILTTLSNHPIMFSHLCSKIQTEFMHSWRKSMYEDSFLSDEDTVNISKILKI